MTGFSSARERWQPFLDFLADKSRLLITTHVNPDGDALGSEIALSEYLQSLGKEERIVNADPTPAIYAFLDPDGRIERFSPEAPPRADACIVVDAAELHRLGAAAPCVERLPVACIDHHFVEHPMGQVGIIDPGASSTGEMIFDFITAAGAALTPVMADALYTCLLTDTGGFRFNNTTARTHRAAAELLEAGARMRFIYESVYESYTKQRALLKGELLANLRFEVDDRLCWFVLSQEALRRTGASLQDAEGFSELANVIRSVKMSILFTELEDGTVKVGLRSKGAVPVRPLAEAFGGGGHLYAAGAVLRMPLAEAISVMVPAAIAHLQQVQVSAER